MQNSASVLRLTNSLRAMLLPLLALSMFTNLSVLIVPLFMMQVFNRVVGTGNLHTLALLTVLATGLLAGIAVVEALRDRALIKVGYWLRQRAETEVSESGTPNPLASEDAAAIQSFLINGSLHGALSLTWLPLFVLLLGMQAVSLALIAIVFGAILLGLNLAQNQLPGRILRDAHALRSDASAQQQSIIALGVLSPAMGMGNNLLGRRNALLAEATGLDWQAQRQRNDLAAALGFVRSLAQIALLASGVTLLLNGAITAGGTIAATLIGGKILTTLEGGARAIGDAKKFLATLKRMDQTKASVVPVRTDIADLSGALSAETLLMPRAPGMPPRLDRISFQMRPGECLAILGESGSGKTSLLQALAGVVPTPIGSVRFDQTDIRTLPADRTQQLIGYLPQSATLMRGTLAENISRWTPNRDDAAVLAAAKAAGVHSFISGLTDAYETRLPEAQALISPGQAQRIALARAFYGRPRFLILDEPNALLDPVGERLLYEALSRMKADGCTIVMSMHRGGVIGLADRILVMDRGRIADIGPRREVLERLDGGQRQIHLTANEASADDLSDWLATQFRRTEDADLRSKTIKAGRDMFDFARANGPNSGARRLTANLKFVDDLTCILTLSEARRTQLHTKIEGVRRRLLDPGQSPGELPPDEASLARVLASVSKFEFQSAEKSSAFVATLVSEVPTGEVRH